MNVYGNAQQKDLVIQYVAYYTSMGATFNNVDESSIRWFYMLYASVRAVYPECQIKLTNDGVLCLDFGLISVYELSGKLPDVKVSDDIDGFRMIDYSRTDEHCGFILYMNLVVSIFWMNNTQVVFNGYTPKDSVYRQMVLTLRSD